MEYFFSIFFGTFVLEDVAMASALALLAENKLTFSATFLACFLGIGLGDLGVFALGLAAAQFGHIRAFAFLKKRAERLAKVFPPAKKSGALGSAIVVARVIPGTRVPTYFAAGFLGFPLGRFILITLVTVSAWVFIALSSGRSLYHWIGGHWLLNFGIFFLLLQFIKFFIPKFIDPWERKALRYTGHKWRYFEFWPAGFFYLPLVPYYLYLSIRYRGLLTPFYLNPHLENGGLVGESKWSALKHFLPASSSIPRESSGAGQLVDSHGLTTFIVSPQAQFAEIQEILLKGGLTYPFIMKPDVGQRGFGVRIIRDDADLNHYLTYHPFARLLQRISQYSHEAGIFYVRDPASAVGSIFSITDKEFPHVIGDGKTKLGDLILKDERARLIAPIYFARWRARLDQVPGVHESLALTDCGVHSQGAIFHDASDWVTSALTQEVDQIAKQIPSFYFGRFDVRYRDRISLLEGKHFELVAIRGAGAEATHIWDRNTPLQLAYQSLFQQWRLLFSIGAKVRAIPGHKRRIRIASFIRECLKVFFRRDDRVIF